MDNSIKIRNGFTHGGKFHADDVFATALLKILFPKIRITRGFEVPKDFDGIVYDIGFGKFDHHQADKEIRENGVPYAAFGLLWREFGSGIVGEEEAKRFDKLFVQPLDESDNTGKYCTMASVIGDFNPGWNEEVPVDARFWEAEAFAKKILNNYFKKVKGYEAAENLIREAMKNGNGECIVLEKFIPWKKAVCGTSYHTVVYPSKRGGYSVQIVPVSEDDPALTASFPDEWKGAPREDLPSISGIETMTFCHASGFLAAAGTLDDALLIAGHAVPV
ncbi:MAG: MYG1 family protein [Lachnospiraceae bacterium]|jgi:uncharacterized UPF0160 family protein|nr:MYG1 family protein [Lachnospiraceae bacterium]MEE3460597.1 MYG1 family protein [Lachnospiraceae bacterium]